MTPGERAEQAERIMVGCSYEYRCSECEAPHKSDCENNKGIMAAAIVDAVNEKLEELAKRCSEQAAYWQSTVFGTDRWAEMSLAKQAVWIDAGGLARSLKLPSPEKESKDG